VYSGTLAVTAIFFTLLWLYAAGNHRLVDRELDPLLLRAMTRRYVLGMILYILAFALAFLSPAASLALIVVLALIFVLPEPEGPRSTRRTTRGSIGG
jgi:ABC-type transport system involved in cytochrome bd biosynthesis fused ATPase/permease subunit